MAESVLLQGIMICVKKKNLLKEWVFFQIRRRMHPQFFQQTLGKEGSCSHAVPKKELVMFNL